MKRPGCRGGPSANGNGGRGRISAAIPKIRRLCVNAFLFVFCSCFPSGMASPASPLTSSSSPAPSPSSLFIPSTTASDITPFPSMSTGGSTGDNAGSNSGPSLASSASLYRMSPLPNFIVSRDDGDQQLTARPFNQLIVYTFLATLVLLLSVSAAIVVRSYILRRRHRREIEEAIRNGTWIPPSALGRSAARVDLSKKPRMWDAYLDLYHPSRRYSTSIFSEEKDWDSMKPLMVSYINGSKPSTTTITVTRGDSSNDRSPAANGNEAQRRRNLFSQISRGVRDVLTTTSREPQLPLSYPVNNGSSQDVPLTEVEPSGPPKVSVAILIAMPRQHSSPSSSKLEPSSSFSSPTLPTLTTATVLNSSPRDEEEELPHIEMGVVELVVSEESHHIEDDHRIEKAKGRESMASGATV